MNHCMIDLETLGTSNEAVISHLGAVVFELDGSIGHTHPLYHMLDINDQQENGRLIEADTVKWWMEQSDEVRAEFKKVPIAIPQSLSLFKDYCEAHKVKKIWGNGNTFDNMILRDLYNHTKNFRIPFHIDYPVSFRDDMDMRTFKLMVKLKDPHYKFKYLEDRVAHNALEDAKNQVHCIQHAWKDVFLK